MKKQRLLAMAVISLVAAIMLQWTIAKVDQKNQMREVFVLNENLAAGQFLDLDKCKITLLAASDKDKNNYLTKEELAKRPKIAYALNRGTLLQNSHLQSSRDAVYRHSMVIRLNDEEAHQGNFATGELVDAICYRQGESKRLQGIEIIGVEAVNQVESRGFILTLRAEVSDLETMMLAQSEGVVRIIKKVSIQ